jgi:hypothetical protein
MQLRLSGFSFRAPTQRLPPRLQIKILKRCHPISLLPPESLLESLQGRVQFV